MSKRIWDWSWGLAVCALAALPGAALPGAAQTDPPPTEGDGTNSPMRLPAVIVTAQKVPEEARALPVSLTPVTRETLQQADVRFVKEAELYAPNVFLNEFSARKLSNPYFRGLGASPLNPGVTTYIDGVPQLNANSSSIELLDVEQIEFVRGPQGALFGRNTVGGLINVTSRRPAPVWTADAQGEYGNYNYRDARVSASGPLGDGFGLGLAGGYSARDGYTKNDSTGHDLDSREAFFGKGQFLWTPAEAWEARLIISGERARDGDYGLGDLVAIRARPHHVSHDFEGFTRRDLVAPTLQITHNGSALEFTSISGFVWWQTRDATDLDYTAIPISTRDNRERDLQFTEELRLASAREAPLNLSDDLKLRWQAGISFFSQGYNQDAANTINPPFSQIPVALVSSTESDLDDIGLGAYGQLTLSAWEKLDFSAGIHGDYENKSADLRTSYSPPVAPVNALSPSRDFCEASPQFGLVWHVTPDASAYATVGRGYKAGGFNPVSPPGKESYGEESSWNYEIGAKTIWLENRVALNVAAFYINWDNLQLNQPTGAPAEFYIANAGGADSKGVEAEVRARPVRGWDLFGAVGYTDARFLSGATAGHVDPLGNTTRENVGGHHLIFSPEFTASGGTQYTLQVCRQAALYARAEVVVYGRYFYNPANTGSQDTYSLAHFRAGVRGNHWFAEGWVRNAFNTDYVPIAFEFPNGSLGGSGFVGESGAPVTFGVRAGLAF